MIIGARKCDVTQEMGWTALARIPQTSCKRGPNAVKVVERGNENEWANKNK